MFVEILLIYVKHVKYIDAHTYRTLARGDFDLHVLRHEVCKHSNNTTTALTTTIAMKRWEKKNS